MNYPRIFLLALAVQVFAALIIYFYLPDYRSLFDEDQLIENLTVGFFLGSALLGLWLLMRRKGDWKLLALVVALGLLGFLDELSFGERAFDLSMPVIAGKKVDGAHDLVGVAISVARSSIPVTVVATLLLAAIALAVAYRFRRKLFELWHLVRHDPPHTAMFTSIALILVAIVLDENLVPVQGIKVVEELLEMNAGVSALFVGLLTLRAAAGTGASGSGTLGSTEVGAPGSRSPDGK